MSDELIYNVSHEELMEEFFFFLETPPNLSLRCNHNKIIKYFQQDTFFAVEKELWKDPFIRQKLINNRCKYLHKSPEELTDYELLSGFKISAIHYGYSGFNPRLAKWFYEKYNINTCYDPCGGWGHRMLGSMDLDLYIYNDLSISTYKGVNNIKQYFDMFNVVTYNEDARYFQPKEKFEAIFTCPPYYNLERYECGEFKSFDEYKELIDSIYNIYQESDCRVLGLVLREDLLCGHDDYTEKFLLTNSGSHLSRSHNYDEYLFVWIK